MFEVNTYILNAIYCKNDKLHIWFCACVQCRSLTIIRNDREHYGNFRSLKNQSERAKKESLPYNTILINATWHYIADSTFYVKHYIFFDLKSK